MLVLWTLLAMLGSGMAMECLFTLDCQSVDRCVGIQDASCVCNNGNCTISGNPFFRGSECDNYTDCSCSSNPERCYCRNGFCVEEEWECHEDQDCWDMDKCLSIDCKCEGNTCEVECLVGDDCVAEDENDYKYFTYPCNANGDCRCEAGRCAGGENETKFVCEFSEECGKDPMCDGIQDAVCVCNFGTCMTVGNPFFRGKECDTYQQCNCSSTPSECFCMDGFCREERWECHEAKDCTSLTKCQGKDCTCSGFVCEHDCDSDADCIGESEEDPNFYKYSCNRQPGYKCKCEENLCRFDKLPAECKVTADCVDIGKCDNDKPCACTNEACVQPWYVRAAWRTDNLADKNCRNEGDCDYSIPMCAGNKCTCENKEKATEYEDWGECQLKEE